MALGHGRRERQMEAFVAASDLPKSSGHPFCTALYRLLAQNGFDTLVEKLCAPYYAKTMGRPGVPPGVFFRMLFVGYVEGLKSHLTLVAPRNLPTIMRAVIGIGGQRTLSVSARFCSLPGLTSTGSYRRWHGW